MRFAKEITLAGTFTALLIGGQLALTSISGVEIVTILLLSFSYCFGVRRGVLVALAFSLLRCFVFGFFPNVLILYLVYYTVFAAVIGFIGYKCRRGMNWRIHALLIVTAMLLTICFTLLDDVITPLFYGYTREAAKAYFFASFTAVIPQTICTVVTVSLLMRPLYRAYRLVKIR